LGVRQAASLIAHPEIDLVTVVRVDRGSSPNIDDEKVVVVAVFTDARDQARVGGDGRLSELNMGLHQLVAMRLKMVGALHSAFRETYDDCAAIRICERNHCVRERLRRDARRLALVPLILADREERSPDFVSWASECLTHVARG
jgi:hypothetical protein